VEDPSNLVENYSGKVLIDALPERGYSTIHKFVNYDGFTGVLIVTNLCDLREKSKGISEYNFRGELSRTYKFSFK